ncbi:MAG: MBL fold metallo-hydrolase [Pseudomonadota bacterium]
MEITFLGAAREVTGSMHLIANATDRFLLDCGMFQGRRKESADKNREMPVDPATITNVLLSHAHIDHSGRIPLLVQKGFAGRIFSTRVTADACEYLLKDAAHIQESDALYLNYKLVRNALRDNPEIAGSKRQTEDFLAQLKSNGHRINESVVTELAKKLRLETIEPLYRMQDAEEALKQFEGYPYRHLIDIGKNATCRFYEAGHILGSAMVVVKIPAGERTVSIAFTGDIGRFGKPILRDPVTRLEPEDREVDLLIIESTYGNRFHDPVGDMKGQLRTVLNAALQRGGAVIIPAFAYGRTQELLYVLHELYDEGSVKRVPVYVDSPLATNITTVFGEHPEVYDAETHETFLNKGKNPFSFRQVKFVGSVEESMALNRDQSPHIVISASGMCEAGRVLHHLRHKIHNPKHTILVVGFMAQHTLGRRILEKGEEYAASGRKGEAPIVRLLNKDYPLKAYVERIGGFSAHGDRDDMMRFLKESGITAKKVAVVHGEEDQALSFGAHLRENGYDAIVPQPGERLTLV